MSKYLQISKIAKQLDVSKDYIRTLIANGELEAVNIGQRATRVSVDSLNRLLERSKIDPEKYFE